MYLHTGTWAYVAYLTGHRMCEAEFKLDIYDNLETEYTLCSSLKRPLGLSWPRPIIPTEAYSHL